MANKMLIDATHAEETRVVVVDGNKVEEFDFESENKRQLAGNIYLAKVTRVEPSLQAAFVDYGGNRHGFLAFSEIHPDYYQIPVADREKLMEEERAYAEAMRARDEEDETPKRRTRSRAKPAKVDSQDARVTDGGDSTAEHVAGMEMIDLDGDLPEGTSPVETVAETPVEEPLDGDDTTPTNGDTADTPDGHVDAFEDDGANDAPRSDAAGKDDSIESVADDDDSDDIRPVRKPRPRKYKIQEVIKVRQILLVQVVKEERGNKGAALTTYLSLAGRYCVLMPNTARGGGISRKITNAVDRKKLKQIATEIDVPQGAGLIVRTAGAKRTKSEIKRDYEYLQRLWEQIRELTLKSVAPAKIYEEGDLIKRSIRDLYNREIDEVLVEGERGYRIAKDFMKMIMPSHAKNVKLYVDPMPLFARYQVESYLSSMFNPTVQLKSGGYIVIGVTEALVAVDVNSGRATKEGSIEETALKTNLEAAEEVARQLRLRDLAGLIVIDFIDMDERKNNNAVEKKLKDKLKSDRARIQVGRISGFGLLEMSRQRLRPGMIEATTQPCPACHGTGLIRSDDNLALSILRQIEEEGVRRRSREVLVKCPVGIANFLMNQKREHVAQIEARYGLSVRIEGDPTLISPDFTLEKFKTATRSVPEVAAPVVSVDSSLMEDADDEEEVVAAEAPAQTQDTSDEGEDKPKKRRRRRRRRSKSKGNGAEGQETQDDTNGQDNNGQSVGQGDEAQAPSGASDSAAEDTKDDAAEKPKPKRTRKPRKKPEADAPAERTVGVADTPEAGVSDSAAEVAPEAAPDATEAKPKPKRTRKPRVKTAATEQPADDVAAPTAEAESAPQAEKPAPKPRTRKAPAKKAPVKSAAKTVAKTAAEPAAETAAPAPVAEAVSDKAQVTTEAPAPADTTKAAPVAADPAPADTPPAEDAKPKDTSSDKPKRRGWWSIGR